MSRRNITKLFIFLVVALLGVTKTYASAEVEQQVQTVVQHTASINKLPTSVEVGSVNPVTGVHNGLQSVFQLSTNGTDGDYDFILKSSVEVDGSSVSAFGQDGGRNSILFGNTRVFPTMSAIENAKVGGNKNDNVVAYPINVSIKTIQPKDGTPMTAEYNPNYGIHGDCFVIKVNNSTEGILNCDVLGTPIHNTYNIAQDQYGDYKVVLTFTAVSK